MHVLYEKENHVPITKKGIPWRYCKKCGLVYLKHGFADWAISKGCNWEDHPGYNSMRKKYSSFPGKVRYK